MVNARRWKQKMLSQWMELGAAGQAGLPAPEHVEWASNQLPGSQQLVSML
jgi:hypothetical protein